MKIKSSFQSTPQTNQGFLHFQNFAISSELISQESAKSNQIVIK